MQFTGLRDKNNLEIFEVDIIEYMDYGSHYYSHSDYETRKAYCKFSQSTGCFYFECDDGDEHTYRELLQDQERYAREHGNANSAYRNGKFVLNLCSIDIVGNIYQNPKLVEKWKKNQ